MEENLHISVWAKAQSGTIFKEFFFSFQDHTMVGRPDAPKEQDIQLSGLGIMPEHCILELENNEVYLTPHEGAR